MPLYDLFQVDIFMITTTYEGLSCTRHTCIKSTCLIIMNEIITFYFSMSVILCRDLKKEVTS
jgi:hypothetical protein